MINEREFSSKKNIKYVFREVKNSNKLIIVFSGYSNNSKVKAPYNYMKSLRDVNINQLFISDSYGYDGRGCWYLGEDGLNDVEESVIELINYIINKLNIDKKDIIVAGTSKGGFASLYYGIKYEFGNIISGGPQVYLYKYLEKLKNKNILNCITNKEEDQKNLDKLIVDLSIEKNTKIFIVCGIKDTHLNNHVIPFVKENLNISNIYLDIVYGEHNNLGEIYREKLPVFVNNIINDKPLDIINLPAVKKIEHKLDIKTIEDILNKDNITIKIKDDKLITYMEVANIYYQYACYAYYGNRIEKSKYNNNPYFEFDIIFNSLNKIKWFIKDELGNIISKEVKFKFTIDIDK